MNHSIYIYYKVSSGNQDKVRAAANELIAQILRSTGIQGRLLCRRDKPETWMEVYEDIVDPDAFQNTLNEELERMNFADILGRESRRMTELFRPL